MDTRLLAALSLHMLFFALELYGLYRGLSVFRTGISLFCTLLQPELCPFCIICFATQHGPASPRGYFPHLICFPHRFPAGCCCTDVVAHAMGVFFMSLFVLDEWHALSIWYLFVLFR